MTAHAFPCAAFPHLFDTMGGPDDPAVQEAKRLCHTCPAIFTCRQQGRDGHEWGVWGGESQPERNLALDTPNEERPECGTYDALMIHRGLKEKCEVCQEARQARKRDYYAKRRAEGTLVQEPAKKSRGGKQEKSFCPSVGAYKRHRKRGEDPTPCGCKDAYNAHRRDERAAKARQRTPYVQVLADCPSVGAYRRHLRRGESTEACGCRAAMREASNNRKKKSKKKEDVA
ncbi:WhiB family transcriptional regulator [Streptomyces sp. NPDC088752]|uniref:WhiB family transcriptional regulator n=1 Tax=Streptomyces sp. NPDC088752 TaxID=3154963 RepID=UPI00341C3EDE